MRSTRLAPRPWLLFAMAGGILALAPGAPAAQTMGGKIAPEVEPAVAPDLLDAAGSPYSQYAGRATANEVLFGDTHVHTDLSYDAGLHGTTLTAREAYRLARGEEITSNTGQPVQLVRPLDFLVVTDHAEYFGLASMIRDASPALLGNPYGRFLHEGFNAGPQGASKALASILSDVATGHDQLASNELARGIWNDFVRVADEYDAPGRFSALTGFEWSATPDGNALHRVVVFGDGADATSQVLPYSLFDSQAPEDLWEYLARYEKTTGGTAIAIPHGGHASHGTMFNGRRSNADSMNREYAESRVRWEPIIEVTQMSGDAETHVRLSPEDVFADFETAEVASLEGSASNDDGLLEFEYARSALLTGLRLGKKLDVNPYRVGMIGATGTHTGLATTREENFFGDDAQTEPSRERVDRESFPATEPALRIMGSQQAASGLTAVWTRENTRASILAAMKRKEVYATTGTRIRVRVFGGWDFDRGDLQASDFAAVGYAGGVPMGGELANAPSGKGPSFLIRATRDPDGANLDRVQIVKGWLDPNGEGLERIYDVAVSDGRKIGRDGRCKEPVGSTVDTTRARYSNAIGDPVLEGYWTDPEFDAERPAFYYVRVLEIPTPRWTTYDAARFEIARPKQVPASLQDRAYTSPIWYTP